jgi:large subunit ribosomal protein L29
MKADKVREIDTNDLKRSLDESREQLFRLRFQMAMGQTEGLKKYRALRRERARMLTILRERELKEGNQ